MFVAFFLPLLLAEVAAPPAAAACTCAVAMEHGGWCEADQVGYLATIEIRSWKIFEALDAHGHELNLDSFRCPSCQRAIATDGFCSEHRIGFFERLAYFSRLTHVLAKNPFRPAAAIACPVCRKNSESLGWCEACKVGMIGGVAVADRQEFDDAARSIRILHEAIAAAERCEDCAVAILTDTQCPVCRISYRDGKKQPAASSP
jgi:hypothetical protein